MQCTTTERPVRHAARLLERPCKKRRGVIARKPPDNTCPMHHPPLKTPFQLLQHLPQLRRLDWRGPLLLPQGVAEPRALDLCSRLGLWHVVHCDAQIDWLAAHKSQLPQHIWLPLAGAGQPGFALERLRSAYARLSALPQVEAITLVLHDRADLPAFVRASADLAGEQVLCQPLPADLHTLPSTPLPATLTQVWYATVQDDASEAGVTTF